MVRRENPAGRCRHYEINDKTVQLVLLAPTELLCFRLTGSDQKQPWLFRCIGIWHFWGWLIMQPRDMGRTKLSASDENRIFTHLAFHHQDVFFSHVLYTCWFEKDPSRKGAWAQRGTLPWCCSISLKSPQCLKIVDSPLIDPLTPDLSIGESRLNLPLTFLAHSSGSLPKERSNTQCL